MRERVALIALDRAAASLATGGHRHARQWVGLAVEHLGGRNPFLADGEPDAMVRARIEEGHSGQGR